MLSVLCFIALLLTSQSCCCCAAAAVDKLASPKEFFTACYHTLLCCPESSDSSSSSSSSSGKITQQLCVKVMAAAYSAHAGTIGPFEGIPHLLQLLDNTQQRSLRHALLLFLQALIAPKAAGELATPPPSSSTAPALPNVSGPVAAAAAVSQSNSVSSSSKLTPSQQKTNAAQAAAVRAAKANGYLLVDHGGLQLLVDFVAGAHECTERRMAAAAAAGAGGAAGAGHLITSISHAEVRCC
jgi:DnaJ family protein C protein 13